MELNAISILPEKSEVWVWYFHCRFISQSTVIKIIIKAVKGTKRFPYDLKRIFFIFSQYDDYNSWRQHTHTKPKIDIEIFPFAFILTFLEMVESSNAKYMGLNRYYFLFLFGHKRNTLLLLPLLLSSLIQIININWLYITCQSHIS